MDEKTAGNGTDVELQAGMKNEMQARRAGGNEERDAGRCAGGNAK